MARMEDGGENLCCSEEIRLDLTRQVNLSSSWTAQGARKLPSLSAAISAFQPCPVANKAYHHLQASSSTSPTNILVQDVADCGVSAWDTAATLFV